MAKILQFPKERSRVYAWAEKYVDVWSSDGWFAASKYIKEVAPKQFWHQTTKLVEQEFLRRGIQVEF